eukprot:CAMPEP_0174705850 /NCGR_PEP_ID=MMETSP1094-20130205/8925_1 /TAXON_ID=156173 /ORGANISM="Chrysochromulina brevifilum, Strain UTEX LB 985" /LENGTH=36 /DNA_ID= /DNA_START= /DNA_END= /DNA_ORIENTATION=
MKDEGEDIPDSVGALYTALPNHTWYNDVRCDEESSG